MRAVYSFEAVGISKAGAQHNNLENLKLCINMWPKENLIEKPVM